MIQVLNDRRVFPNNVTISNQYENETRTIQFDLSDVEFTGNTYLICKYQNNAEFYNPLLLDENFSIPVETFLSAKAGSYSCVLAISTATIDENYDFSTDNPLFVSNMFTLNVQANFLTGTSTAWGLTPAAQNYFDQLIALVKKVQSDLDSGAFNGNGIQNIEKISTSGLVDTYQITFTNGSTFEYEVTNGEMPVITIQNGNWYVNGVDTGQQAQGQTGATPNIQIGTVTTLQPDQQATASISGTPENPLLNFGIPQGQTGQGSNNNKLIGTVAKSENPTLSDSFESNITNLMFYGQSTQIQTTGSQLFDISKVIDSNNVKVEGNSIIVQNGNYGALASPPYTFADYFPNAQVGKTYTLSFAYKNINYIYLSGYNQHWASGDSKEITEEILTSKVTFYASDGETNIYSNIMLNEGSSILPYEPYTGDKPSPSPEYPQEITKISEINGNITGKNLFNPNSNNTVEGLYKSFMVNPLEKEIVISITDNDIDTDISGCYLGFSENGIDSNKTVYWLVSKGSIKHTEYVTKKKYLTYSPNTEETLQTLLQRFNIQVELGSNATEYSPFTLQSISFTPPQPLYSMLDGSVADVVDVENGQYIYNLGVKIVDENSNPQVYGSESLGYGFYIYLKDMKVGNSLPGICNVAISGKFNSYKNQPIVTLGKNNNVAYFTKIFDSQQTVQQIKEWLKSNPITIVYPLAEPTTEPIPSETLQQLKALQVYTGITNFNCNAPVTFQYEQSLQIVIQNIWNAINQTNANLLLTGGN